MTDLATIKLGAGKHDEARWGMCLLEAVAYVAGEDFSDHPVCVSPILSAYGRSLNDALPDVKRQELVPFIPRLIGTAGDSERDQLRGLMAADWLIRVYTPVWLRLVGLEDAADSLKTLPRLATWGDVGGAVPAVKAARESAEAAARPALDATHTAAWGAWDAASAVWEAGRAAWEAWRAARKAGGAGEAAQEVDWAARAARAAWARKAGDALAPTATPLQDSAINLFDRMIDA